MRRSDQISLSGVLGWTIEDVVLWAIKVVNIDENQAQKLKEQQVDGVALLDMTYEKFRDFGILGGPATKLYSAVQKMKPALPERSRSINLPREEDVWLYTVYVSIDGGDDCTGILLQSATSADNRHLLLNLHSFAEQNDKREFLPRPVPGFPGGYEDEFKELFPEKKCKKMHRPKSDPLTIKISRVQFTVDTLKQKTENVIQICEPLVLAKKDVIYCSGMRDALVLFDLPLDKMGAAPISTELRRSDRVHLYGFTHVSPKAPAESFVLHGEITRISGANMNISALVSPGLSGAIILDDTGFVVGYIGGGFFNPEPFGSYGFTIQPVSEWVIQIDTKKKKKRTADEKREQEEERRKREAKGIARKYLNK
eukprot:TRINITY_DN2875_c0_g3_i2.p1 TRINITY_DN2875_c0_g3~~TRINITY_DN2875_c0_g3_i2.p1  ORF type:complete len:368 (-),score=47.11 TRINITY_DN2875_c0_g3_i2:2-1105(-)